MEMYIDLFFIFNVIMDYIIIMSTSILLKRRTSYIRMILSSLIGGISSLVLFTSLNKIVIEIVSIVIMVLISFGYKGIRYLINNILYMYILSTLLGGIIYLFNIKVSNSMFLTYLIIIVISIEIMILYIKENKKMRSIYNNYYKVDIYFKDREKLSLIGFVDTGNNLYDPYKKRPVIIVHNKYIKEDKYILVPYHTINGNGLLKCIKPDIIFIDGIGYKGNVLIGFSDSFNFGDGVDVILHKDIMRG
jgi:stage II sporulation protein GA (sporulation sigma-E factor processing peptidase)